jgi:GMP synthase-like glutamine amidotransferase
MMKQFRIRCLQHVPFEGPAYIKDWALQKNHAFAITHLYEGEALPALHEFDFLVVMGGPMGVNDHSKYTWLSEEKTFIRTCVELGKPVIGICLGAQLMAAAMGAPVTPNHSKEIGWFNLSKTEAGMSQPLLDGFHTDTPVFHWHGDTFGIPRMGKHLLKSDACVNQAFIIGINALALQFHLEMTPESLQGMLENCGDELLADGPFIQTASQILSNTSFLSTNNQHLAVLLDKLTAVI